MGIQSTRYIDRETAIRRLLKIDALLQEKDYRALEFETSERDEVFSDLVNRATPLNTSREALEKWTDTMLGDQMDYPLYRFSLFDNYLIREGDGEDDDW